MYQAINSDYLWGEELSGTIEHGGESRACICLS